MGSCSTKAAYTAVSVPVPRRTYLSFDLPYTSPAEQTAQHEIRALLLKRRKEFERHRRLKQEAAAAAKVASTLTREAYHEREMAIRSPEIAADVGDRK